MSSLIKVKGFRNTIHWNVTNTTHRDIELRAGRGASGSASDAGDDEHPGTCFRLRAEVSGGLLNGPVGRLVAHVLESEVQKSVDNLASLA